MKHKKILNLLNKLLTIDWNIFNDQSNENYSAGNEIIYNIKVLISNLCNYNGAYILARGNITVIGHNVVFKNCESFTNCITKTDGTTTDDGKYLDLVMTIYNLLKYISNYSDSTGILLLSLKNELTNFNIIIANSGNFKTFMHKAKLFAKHSSQWSKWNLKQFNKS